MINYNSLKRNVCSYEYFSSLSPQQRIRFFTASLEQNALKI